MMPERRNSLNAEALLDVVKRRLENVTQKIAEGQKAVFETESLAMEAAFSVWVKLRENREARAKTVFSQHFRCQVIGRFAKGNCLKAQP
jgi:hypothetical protein